MRRSRNSAWSPRRAERRSVGRLFVLCGALAMLPAGGAALALNPICTGSCSSGGNSACATSADCAIGSCAFPDSCLPDGAFAIGRVIEDDQLGANAYTTYLAGVPSTADATSLYWHSAGGDSPIIGPYDSSLPNPLANPLPVTPGKRYYFAAKLKAPPRGAASFKLILDNGDPAGSKSSEVVFGPSDWTVAGLVFTPTTATHYSLQIQGSDIDGSGEFGFKEAVLYELSDYGVYARFQLLSSPEEATLRDLFTLRHNFEFYPTGEFLHTTIPAGGFSDWLSVHTYFSGWLPSYRNLFGSEVRASDGVTPLTNVSLRIQVATQPDPSAVIFDRVRNSPSGRVGMILPDQLPSPPDLVRNTMLLSDLVAGDRARLTSSGVGPTAQPSSFWVGSDGAGGIDSFDDTSAMDDIFPLFRDLGMTVRPQLFDAGSISTGPSFGLGKAFFHSENIVYPFNALPNDYDLDAISATARDYAARNSMIATMGPTLSDAKDGLVVMDDEAGGMPFTGPLYRAAFHAYLAEHGVLLPQPDPDPYTVGSERPDPLADPAAARLYYWQLRFWNEASAQAYKRGRLAIEQAPGSGRPYAIGINVGVPLGQYFKFDFGTEFQTLARAGGVSLLFVEAFLGYNDWCVAQDMGALADYYAAQAKPFGLPMGAYLHTWKGITAQKALTLAARGFRYFNYYTYGPFDMTTGDGRGGFSTNAWELGQMARAGDALARSQSELVGGTRPTSNVAMIASQSDPIWIDGAALNDEELGWHLLLQHAARSADFIVEERLPAQLTTERMLLISARQHLSDAAFAAIRAWVEAGGTLVLAGETPTRNEYGQPDAARAAWIGMTLQPQPDVGPDGQIVQFVAPPRDVLQHGAFSVVDGSGDLLATYPNGTAAVRGRTVGLGRIVTFGFASGIEYSRPKFICDPTRSAAQGAYPWGYDSLLRSAVIDAIAAPAPAVEVDNPLVEAHRLSLGDGGGSIVLLDYNATSVSSVGIRVPGLGPQCSVQRQIGGGAPLTPDASGAMQVPISQYELLSWGPCAGCTAPNQKLFIQGVTRSSSAQPVLSFSDSNPSASVTGYNIYRASNPTGPWTKIGSNVTDGDPGSAGIQFIDPTGDQGNIWYYQVAAFNAACGAEGPW